MTNMVEPDDFDPNISGGTWRAIVARYNLPATWAVAIDEAARAAGGSGIHLAKVIAHESRFDPQAQYGRRWGAPFKPGIATGLIQFTPTGAKGLGVTTDEIFDMDFMQQMELVEEYLVRVAEGKGGGGPGVLDTQEKMALAVFYPAWRNHPMESPLSPSAQKANPGILTVGDYVRRVLGESSTASVGDLKLPETIGGRPLWVPLSGPQKATAAAALFGAAIVFVVATR